MKKVFKKLFRILFPYKERLFMVVYYTKAGGFGHVIWSCKGDSRYYSFPDYLSVIKYLKETYSFKDPAIVNIIKITDKEYNSFHNTKSV